MSDATALRLFDTHAHLNFRDLADETDWVLARAEEAGVTRCLVPAIDLPTSDEAAALAARYPNQIFAAAGVHPNSSADYGPDHEAALADLLASGRFLAVGEIGLDYHWDDSPRDAQFRALESQLALATRYALPVIIHNREASDDVMAILEGWSRSLTGDLASRPGVLHSFSGTQAIADRALAVGFYLGFTGPLTYKKADDLRAIAAAAPLDRMLIETDSPFLTPTPYRGKRNEPALVRLVAEKLAEIRGVSLDVIAEATTANAERLFGLAPLP